MLPSFRIFRISKTRKEFDDGQIERANAAVVHGRKVLTDNPLPGHVHGAGRRKNPSPKKMRILIWQNRWPQGIETTGSGPPQATPSHFQ